MRGSHRQRLKIFLFSFFCVVNGFAPSFIPRVDLSDLASNKFRRFAVKMDQELQGQTSSSPRILISSNSKDSGKLILSQQSLDSDKSGSRLSLWKPIHNFWSNTVRSTVTKWRKALKRPGVQFRVALGVVTTIAVSVGSFFVPTKRVLLLTRTWVAQRGFQGISALGRSLAYIWAVLVAYPRMLDRRANDRRAREKENSMDRRRKYLRSLAGEVVRLRQELSSIDSEIRAFRREIISLKAYANKENGMDSDVQEAIASEMAHLSRLREDTQAALIAARQTWSEVRAKSPSEAWEDDILLMDSSIALPEVNHEKQ